MGRARANAQTVATTGFSAAFGTRRGSVEAQHRRDREEERARELGLTQERALRLASLEEWRRSLGVVLGGTSPAIERLAASWAQPESQTPEHREALISSLVEEAKIYPRELAYAVERGDPAGLEGATEPLVAALVRHLASASPENISEILPCAQAVITSCFLNHLGLNLKYMSHVAPLAPTLSAAIKYEPKDSPGEGVAFTAARTLRICSFSAIAAGQLQCWVEALGERAAAGRLSEREFAMLRETYDVRCPEQQYAEVFAPLVPYLSL